MAAAALVAWAAVAAACPAAAQINPFKRMGADLPPEDLQRLEDTAARLYRSGDEVSVGTVEAWENPVTGNSGTVELVEAFETEGMPCRRLQHRIEIRGRADPVGFAIDRCRTPDGTWKIR